ncbi:MAG: allantoinase, partial [Ktedonobacteraceae bacterium]|nr:allantoinase [Ktedonobacteraceae bacterium]
SRKGRLEPGCDADLALVDLRQHFELQSTDLYYRHQHSPYVGRRLRGRVVCTLLRGTAVFRDGQCIASQPGHLVKPGS